MALSAEAVIAIVGVLINFPTFVLVFWHIWAKKRRRSSSSHRLARRDSELQLLEEHQLFNRMPLHPRHAFPMGRQLPMFAWYPMPWGAPYDFNRRAS